ncbi:Hypothetical predicted protein [Marmota monax]|uniref:Uncharacterized protein n=1 Tax=Marmota monax TaxID=9995 RepID=A0A5E4CEG5_MARMO|nr:Hypothetical predicted protein [Marmota monax]
MYNICYHSTKLREVIVRDLLPSSAMIKDLSQEFGLPISQEDLMDQKLPTISPQPVPNLEGSQSQVSTLNSKVLAHQEKYLQWRNNMLLTTREKHYLIQKNIMKAFQATKRPPVPKAKIIRISTPLDKGVHNYSVMTFNSAVLAKKELCQEMAKEPGRRFTYSQNYLSAIVEPQDSQEEKKKAQEKSRQAWLTVTGFQVTGLHGDILHQDFPLPAIGEFHEEWQEHQVLDRLLYPMLDRGRWSWDRRHLDFELYKKPPPFLEVPPPPTRKPVADNWGDRAQLVSTSSSQARPPGTEGSRAVPRAGTQLWIPAPGKPWAFGVWRRVGQCGNMRPVHVAPWAAFPKVKKATEKWRLEWPLPCCIKFKKHQNL